MAEKKMISLIKKEDSIGMAIDKPSKAPRGKMLHLFESPELPLDEKDLNKKMSFSGELIPREVGAREINGKKTFTYDLEITGIKIGG